MHSSLLLSTLNGFDFDCCAKPNSSNIINDIIDFSLFCFNLLYFSSATLNSFSISYNVVDSKPLK